MLLEELTRGERSKLHVAMLDALEVPSARTMNLDHLKLQAMCETICWSDHPVDVILLSGQISAFVYSALFAASAQHAEINATELRQVAGIQTVNLALKLAGICPIERGQRIVWTTATDDEHTISISLPDDLFER